MKKSTVLLCGILFAALSSASVFADTMQLNGVNGATTPNGAEYVGPYTVSVNGTDQNLYCLDLFRGTSFGETWTATASTLSTSSSLEVKEAAIVLSQINAGTLTNLSGEPMNVAGQLEIWAILDSTDAKLNGLTVQQYLYVKGTLAQLASDSGAYGDAFYNQFTLYTAVDGSQSTGGIPQDFLGQSVPSGHAPEPGSILLFGTGLFGSAGMFYRRIRSN